MANNETEKEKEKLKKEAEIREKTEAFARRPDLLKCIKEEYDRFIVGEDSNKLLLFLICVSKYDKKPLGAIVTGSSSAGKNWIVDNVTKLFIGSVRSFSRITPASLDRLQENMSNKILVLKELGGLQAQPSLRVWLSEGGLNLLTTERDEEGRMAAFEVATEGVPVFITTTSRYQIEKQLQNRLIMIGLDESKEQTRKILLYQAKKFSKTDFQLAPNPVINAFLNIGNPSILLPFNVMIPYAEEIAKIFPADSITARRDQEKLLMIIKMSAFLHQYQRTKAQDPDNKMRFYVIADKVDFKYALDIGGKSLEQTLAGIQKRAMEALEIFKTEEKKNTRQLADSLKISTYSARNIANALVNAGYLHKDDSQKTHVFELRESQNVEFTNLRSALDHWNNDDFEKWLQTEELIIKEKAPEPQYIAPFSACASRRSQSSSTEENKRTSENQLSFKRNSENLSKDKRTSETLLSPSVTNDRHLQFAHKEKSVQEIIEYMRENLPASIPRKDDAINVCMKTGATKNYCSQIWDMLIRDELIVKLPKGGGYQWHK